MSTRYFFNFQKTVRATLLIAFIVWQSLFSAFGQTGSTDICQPAGYMIAYINGINSPLSASGEVIIALNAKYSNKYKNQQLNFRRIQNPSVNIFLDTLEVFKQKALEDPRFDGKFEIFWALMNGATSVLAEFLVANPLIQPAIDDLRARIIKRVSEKIRDSINAPLPVTTEMVGKIKNLLTERWKVVLVAHSQGNLFANSVYAEIKPTLSSDSLRPVHVAPATAQVVGPYTLSSNDLIIGRLRQLTSVVAPNVELPYIPLHDPTGHFFVETYLRSGPDAADRVYGHLDSAMDAMTSEPGAAGTGLFTITLRWNGSGDVDLHVFEPNSTHVYYGSRTGASGDLDTDNTVADGPEHYTASCAAARMQEGVYTVGIANYSRADGRTATLQLSTLSRTYDAVSRTLGAATGDSSSTVFKVRVAKDPVTSELAVTQE
ncbi:hypothetical protein [Methylibium sp.]|uniref:hypothetical protein n=1 Tax=Methylibium sp. TaxID=2067992 RepID=UPI003D0E1A58